jgi:hypothetical protein
MKTLLVLSILGFLGGRALADIAPDATGAPLFQIYSVKTLSNQPTTDASGNAQPQFSLSKKPLMSVATLADFVMGNDMKAVEVDMNAKDAKTLGKITQKAPLLIGIVSGDGNTIILSQVSGQITDGVLVFSDAHHSGPMADYLRQRFHVKPGTNQLTAQPVQIKTAAAPKTN